MNVLVTLIFMTHSLVLRFSEILALPIARHVKMVRSTAVLLAMTQMLKLPHRAHATAVTGGTTHLTLVIL